ncbi:hypothetical protein [uncultured Chryseobacterium sp.]|uniref:hypothetical protein n=1 Tax=uncultured Chryseobacterium sp. TaxID=259322 RepID=UPI0025D3A521|nr:hypothetical protein [uncultured Chryseobacterium sp.]
MTDNLLISVLKVMARNENYQANYIRTIFNNKEYENIDEILLEYDDAKFLKERYVFNINVRNMFENLEKIIEKIEEDQLFSIKDLNDPLWGKIRSQAQKILNAIQ